MNLGLLTSREGYPLGHWLFPGEQSDVRSMGLVSADFRARLALGSFVVVADRGMVSAGRYQRVAPTIEAKEVSLDGSERLILCRNQARAEDDARKREAILSHLEQHLTTGSWRESLMPGTRRYLKGDGSSARIDQRRIEDDAKYDGKWVLRTTTPNAQQRQIRTAIGAPIPPQPATQWQTPTRTPLQTRTKRQTVRLGSAAPAAGVTAIETVGGAGCVQAARNSSTAGRPKSLLNIYILLVRLSDAYKPDSAELASSSTTTTAMLAAVLPPPRRPWLRWVHSLSSFPKRGLLS